MRMARIGITIPGIEQVVVDEARSVYFRDGVSGDLPDDLARILMNKKAAVPLDPAPITAVPVAEKE